jgi:hypothetical protein
MTSATSPEKLMSLAPIDSRTRSSLRSGWRRLAAVTASRNSASCAFTVPWQLAPDLVGRHSRARCEPNRPSAMVAPVQASGR